MSETPFAGSRFGWCVDGHHGQCRGEIPTLTWPDPSRKGGTYTSIGARCPCPCHERGNLATSESNTKGTL